MKVKSEREVAQSCPTLSDPMDCSLPGSSIHGIFQARVLEWGAIAFSDKKDKIMPVAGTGACLDIITLSEVSQKEKDKFCILTHTYGEGNGTPLQYSCLENPMDGGAWWAAVHGVAKSQT